MPALRSRLQGPDDQGGRRTLCDDCGQRLKIPVPDRCPAAKPFDTDDFLLQGEELPVAAKAPGHQPSVRCDSAVHTARLSSRATRPRLVCTVKCPKCSLPCECHSSPGQDGSIERSHPKPSPSSGFLAPSPPSPTDLETAGPRPIVAPNPKSRSSLAVWGIGFVVLLGVGVASGLLLVNHFRATRRFQRGRDCPAEERRSPTPDPNGDRRIRVPQRPAPERPLPCSFALRPVCGAGGWKGHGLRSISSPAAAGNDRDGMSAWHRIDVGWL